MTEGNGLVAAHDDTVAAEHTVPFRDQTLKIRAKPLILYIGEAEMADGARRTALFIRGLVEADDYQRLVMLEPSDDELIELIKALGEAVGRTGPESLASAASSSSTSEPSRPTSPGSIDSSLPAFSGATPA